MSTITVCVPVYNAEAFVRETLDHIAAQTFADFRVIVSVDRCDDDSANACRMESDKRFDVVTQPERLGWVGNVNSLIARVETPFFCITPHDDLLDPRYLETMHDVLMREPAAACAYSDIQGFGSMQPVVSQPDVRGSRLERVLDVVLNHYSAVTFRGIVRRRDNDDRPFVPTGIPGDFAADSAWTVRLALRGELVRVPELLYHKRYAASTVHAGWNHAPRAEQLRLYAEMVAMCTRVALEEITDPTERDQVLVAGLLRASGHTTARGCAIPAEPYEIASAVAEFALAIQDLGPLPDIERVLQHTRVTALHDAPHNHVSLKDAQDADESALATRVLRKARSLMGLERP